MKVTATTKTALDLILPMGIGGYTFYTLYQKKGDYKEAGMVALIVAAVTYIITSQITKGLVAATINSLSSSKRQELAQEYGANEGDLKAAQERARIIHVAFYGEDGNAWTEDEDTAIATINQCRTPSEVKLTCSLYQATYGKSLSADFTRFTSSFNEWETPYTAIIRPNWF